MANANSFADVINRQNNGQPLVIAVTTTTHQSFNLANGSQALLTIPNPMASIDAGGFFPNFSADGRPFILRAAGKVLGGEKFQIDIVAGTGLVNVVATTGLNSAGLASDNFMLEFQGMWDSQSNTLRGIYYGFNGSVSVNQAGIVSTVSLANLAALQFNVALTIATANANANVQVTEFSGEFV